MHHCSIELELIGGNGKEVHSSKPQEKPELRTYDLLVLQDENPRLEGWGRAKDSSAFNDAVRSNPKGHLRLMCTEVKEVSDTPEHRELECGM